MIGGSQVQSAESIDVSFMSDSVLLKTLILLNTSMKRRVGLKSQLKRPVLCFL